MNKIYLSGPIAHYELSERREAFEEAEKMLKSKGFAVVNPMKNGLPQPGDWRAHMRADIKNLLTCDGIYLMEGWNLSKGCRLELDVAMSCGLLLLDER